jgi:hypothetical protein
MKKDWEADFESNGFGRQNPALSAYPIRPLRSYGGRQPA